VDHGFTQCCLCCVLLQVSALPVVNEQGALLDIYARADITKLCKGNAYSRLQWEDVTVRHCTELQDIGGGGAELCCVHVAPHDDCWRLVGHTAMFCW
jgi:hypothetical protein